MIIERMRQAAAAGADAVIFSELALCGYYPGDWLEERLFLQKHDDALAELIDASRATPQLVAVVGAVRRNLGPGKPLYNALLVLRNGAILAEYYKQLLPTYGIFDEGRHFQSGPERACIVNIGGAQVGFMVCEDGWNDEKKDYAVDPFDALAQARPDLVISINASPSNLGKRAQRHRVFAQASRNNGLPLLWVNQVGGQDQLVFDGASFAVSPAQGVAYEALRFEQDFDVIGFTDGRFVAVDGNALPEPPQDDFSDPEFARQQIVLGLRDYARRCGFKTVVVGSSGGIDSALTLALAVDALGADNVFAITMPSAFSSEGSVTDSEKLCRNLGIRLYTHPIRALVDQYKVGFESAFDSPLQGLTLENLQARIRAAILMEYSNAFGALLLTTGNKSETSVGYATYGGDTLGGLGLIGDLYKTEVYALSGYINDAAGRATRSKKVLVSGW